MELAQIRALVETVEQGSFIAASRSLAVSPSTLRSRIDALERVVGVPLLLRTTRGVLPTETGERLVQRGRPLLAQAEQLLLEMRSDSTQPLGEVHIRLPSGPTPAVVQGMFAAISQRYPDLRIHLDTRPTPLDDLDDSVDVVVYFGGLPERGEFLTTLVRSTRVRLMASPAYLERHGPPTSPKALQAHRLLLWTPSGAFASELPIVGGANMPVRAALSSPDTSVVHAAAVAGMGLAWLPEALAGVAASSPGELELVLADEVCAELQVRVLVPLRAATMARCHAVLETLKAVAALVAQKERASQGPEGP